MSRERESPNRSDPWSFDGFVRQVVGDLKWAAMGSVIGAAFGALIGLGIGVASSSTTDALFWGLVLAVVGGIAGCFVGRLVHGIRSTLRYHRVGPLTGASLGVCVGIIAVILHSPFDFRFRLRDRSGHPLVPATPRPQVRPAPAPGGFKLGIWTAPVTEVLRIHLKLREGEGILVEEVVPGSLADRMGIKRLDIIRTVNTKRVGTTEDIRKGLEGVEPGGKVEVEVIRRGDPLKLIGAR